MRNDGDLTSTWSLALRSVRRFARRGAMPVAWTLTLVVVAFSAFAVRDTVFPTLGHSATPSVWEPTPAATAPRTSTSPGGAGADDVPGSDTRPTVLVVDLPDGSSTSVDAPAAQPRSGALPAGPPYRGPGDGTSSRPTPSSSTSLPPGHSPSPATSSPSPSTTEVTGSSTPSSTTDPSTTDSIGGGQNGKGSGSGGGGTDDDHP